MGASAQSPARMERAHDPIADDLVSFGGPLWRPPRRPPRPEQLALIVQHRGPYSVEIGAYYAPGAASAANVSSSRCGRRDRSAGRTLRRKGSGRPLPANRPGPGLAGRHPSGWTAVDHHRVRVRFDPAFWRQGLPTHAAEPLLQLPSRAPFADLALRPASSWPARAWRRARP